jgi:TusA-related sulfurtransferase
VTIVDARGLLCPLPLAMAKRRMADLRDGEILTVLATDPEATIDLGAWAEDEGHAYDERDCGGWTEYSLVKRASRAGRR